MKVYGLSEGQGKDHALGQSINLDSALSLGFYCI